MSSPIYELLKRPDELFVVEHAHLRLAEPHLAAAVAEVLLHEIEIGLSS